MVLITYVIFGGEGDYITLGSREPIDWLLENNIEYEVIDTVTYTDTIVFPAKSYKIPYKIKLTNDSDYIWFKLKWG